MSNDSANKKNEFGFRLIQGQKGESRFSELFAGLVIQNNRDDKRAIDFRLTGNGERLEFKHEAGYDADHPNTALEFFSGSREGGYARASSRGSSLYVLASKDFKRFIVFDLTDERTEKLLASYLAHSGKAINALIWQVRQYCLNPSEQGLEKLRVVYDKAYNKIYYARNTASTKFDIWTSISLVASIDGLQDWFAQAKCFGMRVFDQAQMYEYLSQRGRISKVA